MRSRPKLPSVAREGAEPRIVWPPRYVCIKGRPCKIVDYSTSKTGKHGHAKANIVGIDIFTNKKLEEMCPTSHNLDVPNVVRNEFQVRGSS